MSGAGGGGGVVPVEGRRELPELLVPVPPLAGALQLPGPASASDPENGRVDKFEQGDGGPGGVSAFTADGSTDLKGRPARKAKTGGWTTCIFIYGSEMTDRLAYFAILSNLITYLTEEMHQGLAQASTNVNNWQGCLSILSVFGAFTADAFLGRYYSILLFGVLNLSGLVLLTLAVTLPALKPPPCPLPATGTNCPDPSAARLGFFFGALYLTALGSGGSRSCLSGFGADQFDEEDAAESMHKKSFFNWWYMLLGVGALLAVTLVVYVQENVGWGWGFGLQTAAFGLALAIFMAGTPLYRHQPVAGSPFTQLAQVLVAAARNRRLPLPAQPKDLYQGGAAEAEPAGPRRRRMSHTKSYRFLDKAAVVVAGSGHGSTSSPWQVCSVSQVEEVKLLVRMFPIWISNLMFQASMAQIFTLFTRQGRTMDTRLGGSNGGFKIPSASFQVFSTLTILITIPVYDRVFVPAARRVTGHPRGITLLQRMGAGYLLAIASMACAALTESHRLRYVRAHGLEDAPGTMLPLTIFRLLPQYVVIGVADAFTLVAALEFFYIEAPDHMRTVGSAFNLTAIGVGSFLSSALISLTNSVTAREGRAPWVGDNINRSHIDYFFWLVAVLGAVNLVYFLLVASAYTYKHSSSA